MRKTRGVSLLEIVIAMQITALLLALLSRALPLARRQVRDASRQLGGAILAQNVLEEHLVVPIDQWPREKVRHNRYQTQLATQAWPKDSRMVQVTVTVFLGDSEQYRLETLVVRP